MMRNTDAIGFIGLGAMGYAMAKNLRQKTEKAVLLLVYDVNPSAMAKFIGENQVLGPITAAQSAWEVVSKCSTIFSIVPEGKHVAAVFSASEGGALQERVDGKIFIECSTIDIKTSQSVARAVQAKGGRFVDSPVSGGTSGADAGTITFMVGTADDDPTFAIVKPLLSTMGNNLIACGGPTLGLATKLCNNYIAGTIAIATSEGMNMAITLGLNAKLFSQVVAVSTGGSWVNSHCNPVPGVTPKAPASHNYEPGFKVELMRKDYHLAVRAAEEAGVKLALGDVGLAVYMGASADPACVGRDCRVVYKYLGGK